MTRAEARQMPPGLYRIWWKSGDASYAAVGMLPNGDRWLAPTNWVRPTERQDVWRSVKAAVRCSPHGPCVAEVSNA